MTVSGFGPNNSTNPSLSGPKSVHSPSSKLSSRPAVVTAKQSTEKSVKACSLQMKSAIKRERGVNCEWISFWVVGNENDSTKENSD